MQNSCPKTSAWWSCGSHCVENGYLSLRFPNMVKVNIQEHWMRVTRFNPLWVSVQTFSMNEHKIFHTSSMKKLVVEVTIYEKWPKVQLQVMLVCASITQRSVLIHPCNLRLITTENVEVKCVAFKLVNMCSGKNCLRMDLLDCEDILLCCCGGTDLVFFWLIRCTWLMIQDSGHFSLSLQRCWMVAVEAFQIFVTT